MHADLVRQVGILDYGEVSVIESWSNEYVSTQIAKSCYRSNRRGIKPTLHISKSLDSAIHIRPQRVRDSIYRAIAGDDIEGITALRLENRCKLPALY